MPENTKCVTRPGPWGNPFVVGQNVKTAEVAVEKYRALVMPNAVLCRLIRTHLRGFNLACFCKVGAACHADLLLQIANE